jgi:hypothetical protein
MTGNESSNQREPGNEYTNSSYNGAQSARLLHAMP